MSSATHGQTTTTCDGCGKVLSVERLDASEAMDYEPPADAPKWASFSLTITDGSGTQVISEATGIGHRYKWMAARPISLDLCEECAVRCFKELREVITQRGH